MTGALGGTLQGVNVVEFGHFLLVPGATAILADWGASVTKIENPRGGDPVRFPQSVEDWVPPPGVAMSLEAFNRNKRSVALDVSAESGREVLHKLVQNADVFATNFDPRAIEKARADYDTLSKVNPRLIYCQCTGYGTHGPDRYKPGFDYAAWWARSGIMDRISAPDVDPRPQRPGLGDNLASPAVAGAIAAALFCRERTGIGQKVEFSLYHFGVWGLTLDIQAALVTRKQIRQTNRRAVNNALWNCYQSKGGKWMILVMPQTDRYWTRFCQAVDKPEWEKDTRFDSHEKRMKQNLILIPAIEEIIRTRTAAEWEETAKEYDLALGRIQSPMEVVEDPQAWENGFFTEIDHPRHGRFKLVQSPIQFSKTPASIKSAAPELGQHTEEVLLELGYTWDDIVRLKSERTIL